jgi:hypothetical protein
MDSLKARDAEAAAHAVAPRVALADIEAAIAEVYHLPGSEIPLTYNDPALNTLSICLTVMTNGFIVVGTSRPAADANFNAELGRKGAYEDCIRQLWPLMGYALRDRLAAL